MVVIARNMKRLERTQATREAAQARDSAAKHVTVHGAVPIGAWGKVLLIVNS